MVNLKVQPPWWSPVFSRSFTTFASDLHPMVRSTYTSLHTLCIPPKNKFWSLYFHYGIHLCGAANISKNCPSSDSLELQTGVLCSRCSEDVEAQHHYWTGSKLWCLFFFSLWAKKQGGNTSSADSIAMGTMMIPDPLAWLGLLLGCQWRGGGGGEPGSQSVLVHQPWW